MSCIAQPGLTGGQPPRRLPVSAAVPDEHRSRGKPDAGRVLPRSAHSSEGITMTSSNRRTILGAAALGAGGLVSFERIAEAAQEVAKSDHGKPGEGGFGRQAVQLPPGAPVATHDPKDVAAFPDFRFSLDGNTPKITSGGWAKEATVHQFPISKGIAGVHMFLDPGASRELH